MGNITHYIEPPMPRKQTRWRQVQWSPEPQEQVEEFSRPEYSSIKELITKAFATHFKDTHGIIYQADPMDVPHDKQPVPLVFCSI